MSLNVKLLDACDRMGERNDCAVRAIAVVADVPYEKAHAALAAAGRKPRHRTKNTVTNAALRALGFTMIDVSDQFKGRTVRTLERELPVGKRYLIRTNGHILGARWGECHDFTRGGRYRVKHIFQVEKKKLAPG